MPFATTVAAKRQEDLVRKCLEAETQAAKQSEKEEESSSNSWFLFHGAIKQLTGISDPDFPPDSYSLKVVGGQLTARQ